MQVTSDTLFHFTTSFKNLQNILSKKFHLTYCQEKYTLNNEIHDSYFPMISFCDIPLSLAKDQINKYGSYAIGLTKEWGIKNKLNPVVYIEKDSLLGNDVQNNFDDTVSLIRIINTLVRKGSAIVKILSETKYYEKNKKSFEQLSEKVNSIKGFKDNAEKDSQIKSLRIELESIKAFQEKLESDKATLSEYSESLFKQNKILQDIAGSKINFFRYVKNYQGNLIRKNRSVATYRFYDEREWRYVPAVSDKRVEAWLDEKQYKKYRGTEKTKPLIDKIILNFTSEDIKYLIVKSSKDIPILIKLIQGKDNLTKNTIDAAILTTKILTVEQLKNDF